MKKSSLIAAAVVLVIIAMAIYSWVYRFDFTDNDTYTETDGKSDKPVQMANPASTNCVKLGGNLVIEKRGDGGEFGLCYFEDNRACEEWALFRGNCPSGGVKTTGFDTIDQKYCAWSGGATLAEPQSVCVFKDGSKCPTVEFYNGGCSPDGSQSTDNPAALIRLNNLDSGQTIQSPLTIEGSVPGSWFFEASFPIKIYDDSGRLLGTSVAQANPPAGETWMTDKLVPFKAELKFEQSTSASGTLVLEKDNPSGLPENAAQLRWPVQFVAISEKMKVKVFFNNNKLDPDVSCNKVFPVEREVAKTLAPARAALNELLSGTTPAEHEAGFMTTLNTDIKLQSLTIVDGVAKADFDERLETPGGGSCRGAAITAQIRETLKQFPSVKEVIISINGRSEDILQP